MKLIEQIGAEKRRGAYYSSALLVDACLERVTSLIDTDRPLRVLEPAAGDGAFVLGLDRLRSQGAFPYSEMTCVELFEAEAAKCRQALANSEMTGQVIAGSFFAWADQDAGRFDVLVGNPPFVRYQFVAEHDRRIAEGLLRAEGLGLQGVSNLWIPFVLLTLRRLVVGGAFALVLPSELFTTLSAGQVRSELIRNGDSLQIDLYPRDAFPDILQDVVIVSGKRAPQPQTQQTVTFCEHACNTVHKWQHVLSPDGEAWTRFLLTTQEWEAFCMAKSLTGVYPLKAVATIGVAIVTGANDFFTIDDTTLEQHDLSRWARPLLARTADSPGIVFTEANYQQTRRQGKKAWLLDFSADRPDPNANPRAAEYLRSGEAASLPARYKCRIRTPWFRVPHIQRGTLMMAKRAHQQHRLLLNSAHVFTTDTIYRGDMKPAFAGHETDLVAGFHNSLTLLAAEVEGRTYGGGVLELVPSEIARLSVPLIEIHDNLERLDSISRTTGGQRDTTDALVEATDHLLARLIPRYAELLPFLTCARKHLRQRRFQGSGRHQRSNLFTLLKWNTLDNDNFSE